MEYQVYRGLVRKAPITESVHPSITFAGNKATAEYYAHNPNNTDLKGNCPTVYSATIEINNPFIVDKDYSGIEFKQLLRVMSKVEVYKLILEHEEYVKGTYLYQEFVREGALSSNYVLECIGRNPSLLEVALPAYVFLDNPDIVARLIRSGFDGSIHRGTGVSMDDVEYRIWLSHSQIKKHCCCN
ncbi:hypothetical protein CPT_Moabite_255 [Serratia phage Moabite]|uniref:Uncharacterized protein n=1 Tax=Serratia phage Moabite TaxID=2587814 RepID=A0A4Y5TPH4_9CAUD|nr:hypothetical protein HWC48_gp161 [Serratia phage Moabite]QDB71285.1 hypothetical protein CPT_Moabite_255 [Serratia phage Moabite]UGO54138.1 hypothetical protein HAYMO_156 [Serratia phage vB_SmaM_Haymo]